LVDDAGELLPILRKGYVTHVQSLSRMLQALRLRPDKADKVPDLRVFLADYAAEQKALEDATAATQASAEPAIEGEATARVDEPAAVEGEVGSDDTTDEGAP
jgi:hypothetical protein